MWVGRKEVAQGARVSSLPTWVLNTLENLLTEPPALEMGRCHSGLRTMVYSSDRCGLLSHRDRQATLSISRETGNRIGLGRVCRESYLKWPAMKVHEAVYATVSQI